ncbi:MAG: VOC family protein [bacterium]|nr:VOC family protein [bacterium]
MNNAPIDQQITFLYTHDLPQSAHFYEQILGLALWLDQGSCRIYHVTGSSYLGMCQVSERSKGKVSAGDQQNVIVTLVTEDVDGWYHALSERGVAFEKPPERNATYAIYHCFLRDPKGYLIEIQRFLPRVD